MVSFLLCGFMICGGRSRRIGFYLLLLGDFFSSFHDLHRLFKSTYVGIKLPRSRVQVPEFHILRGSDTVMGWGPQQWIFICYFKSTQEILTGGPEGIHPFLSVFFWSPFGYFWGITPHLLDFWVLSWMGNKRRFTSILFYVFQFISVSFSLQIQYMFTIASLKKSENSEGKKVTYNPTTQNLSLLTFCCVSFHSLKQTYKHYILGNQNHSIIWFCNFCRYWYVFWTYAHIINNSKRWCLVEAWVLIFFDSLLLLGICAKVFFLYKYNWWTLI